MWILDCKKEIKPAIETISRPEKKIKDSSSVIGVRYRIFKCYTQWAKNEKNSAIKIM